MNQKEQIRKELNEYLDKYIPRTEIDIYKHVVNFIKKDRAKQLILSGVSGMFSEEQMEEAWTNGCGCGETRSGYFDIENYS